VGSWTAWCAHSVTLLPCDGFGIAVDVGSAGCVGRYNRTSESRCTLWRTPHSDSDTAGPRGSHSIEGSFIPQYPVIPLLALSLPSPAEHCRAFVGPKTWSTKVAAEGARGMRGGGKRRERETARARTVHRDPFATSAFSSRLLSVIPRIVCKPRKWPTLVLWALPSPHRLLLSHALTTTDDHDEHSHLPLLFTPHTTLHTPLPSPHRRRSLTTPTARILSNPLAPSSLATSSRLLLLPRPRTRRRPPRFSIWPSPLGLPRPRTHFAPIAHPS
jgi:hypothetical protein